MLDYFRRVIKLFKDTKKEKLNSTIDDLGSIKENINVIFDEVVSNKEFSQFRLDLLNRKVCLLQGKQANVEHAYKEYGENLFSLKKELSLIILLMYVFGLLLIPLLGVYSSLLIIVINNIIRHYEYKINDEYTNIKADYEKLIREINNTTTSCSNFIYNKISLYQNGISEENAKTPEIMANELIANYIEHGTINNASKEVWEYAITILQFELHTNETDIRVLLESAREKISENNLNEELTRTRNIEN